MTGIFEARQQVGGQFVKFNAFLIIGSGAFMKTAGLLQVIFNIVGEFFGHLLQIRFVFI